MKKTKLILLTILVALSLAGCTGSKAEKATKQGKEAFENQEYEEALVYFKQALNEGATDFQVEDSIVLIEAYNKALKLYEKGEFQEAEEALGQIKFNYSDYPIKDHIDDLKDSMAKKIEKTTEEAQVDTEEEAVAPLAEDVKQDPVEPEEVIVSQEVDSGKIKRKTQYLDKMAEIEVKVRHIYSQDLVAAQAADESYVLWDDLLNEIWGVLKNNLPQDEMDRLLIVQRQWIKDKESAAKKIYDDGYGTSAAAGHLERVTELRCRELVELYMD